jgi:hypothetical protein
VTSSNLLRSQATAQLHGTSRRDQSVEGTKTNSCAVDCHICACCMQTYQSMLNSHCKLTTVVMVAASSKPANLSSKTVKNRCSFKLLPLLADEAISALAWATGPLCGMHKHWWEPHAINLQGCPGGAAYSKCRSCKHHIIILEPIDKAGRSKAFGIHATQGQREAAPRWHVPHAA